MSPKIIKYLNFFPQMSKKIKGSITSVVIGNVFISDFTKIKKNVIIRGDGKEIYIGKNCILNNRVTVHVAASLQGTSIGNNCFIDEYSVIHACKLKDDVIIGSNSVIMDGSVIGNNVIIQKNSLVPPRKNFPSYHLIGGSPAKVLSKISRREFLKYKNSFIKKKSSSFVNNFNYRDFICKNNFNEHYKKKNIKNFIAIDAKISQKLTMGINSSIWYSVIILSSKEKGEVILGKGSNIQDNSIFDTLGDLIQIGERVTIGHNVIIKGRSIIHDDAVIGMGSILEKDCIVGNNAFVGANSVVKSGTVIPDDTIFAGNPANFFRKVNEKEKKFFKKGQKIYEELTQHYSSAHI